MPREKKPPTGPQLRARKKNLERANEVREANKRKNEISKLDEKLDNVAERIEDEIEKRVAERFKKVDRKDLKNEILQVFRELGGKRFVKKWAKENPGKYLSLMEKIFKGETDGGSKGKGVTINIHGGRGGRNEKDVTPVVEIAG
ncbi:MAG: hypothetical protein KAR06_02355 [Deltaproteobacteria bacterium]|nr:hypothetical protein [Deltaproteobacteria bacterium]